MITRNAVRILVAGVALAVVFAAGCSGAGPTASPGQLVVSGAWARASMSLERAVAVYLSIENQSGSDDALLSVASPAGTAELHETKADASGMMAMMPVGRIDIAKGATVELKSGSYHIMLINLAAMLEVGTSVDLTLTFEHAAPVTVTAEVRAN